MLLKRHLFKAILTDVLHVLTLKMALFLSLNIIIFWVVGDKLRLTTFTNEVVIFVRVEAKSLTYIYKQYIKMC